MSWDVFVTMLSATGNSLKYSTFLGGNGTDFGQGIARDGSGGVYVTGTTSSSDFPTLNAFDSSHNGSGDVFVTKLVWPATFLPVRLSYSTLLGGSSDEDAHGIAVDSSGSAYVTGATDSSDFPTVNDDGVSYRGNEDVFVTKLSSTGTSLTYSTYLGGSNPDVGYCIAVDGDGHAYVAGKTHSPNFRTRNAYDATIGFGSDAFVAKFN